MAALRLELDPSVYSTEAVQKAAYRRMNSLTVDVRTDEGLLLCSLQSCQGVDDEAFALAVEEFRKDILDEQLRLKLKAETADVRNLILGLVFSRTGLVNGHE